MHIPKIFEQNNIDELLMMMKAYPFATLINYSDSGIRVDHIPMYLQKLSNGRGVSLRGHIGKGNPLWKEVAENSESLAVFHGPNHYISPSYYPSKQIDEKVVPTWNYIAVHVKGNITFIHDNDWKLDMLNMLTNQHEESQPKPWSVSDAPTDFTAKMLGGIVGIELDVQEILGQWKISQNKQEKDRKGVVSGLSDIGAVEMSQWVDKFTRR